MENEKFGNVLKFLNECKCANIDPFVFFGNTDKKISSKGKLFGLKNLFIFVAIVTIGISFYLFPFVNKGNCLLEMPSNVGKIFRSPESCYFCHGITEVERVSNIKPSEFEQKFAYTGRPVIIVDATTNWTALDVFSFEYFQEIYFSNRDSAFDCQFFPYKSGFRNLLDALSIPIERVNFQPGTDPWYFGWSNCHSDVSEILREHYSRPYFLPELSESASTDWLFMGGSGLGAHMHVDNVRLPSWQAQLKGSKEWILAPPPECYYECNIFKTVVKTGEIIVLDTNRWYHQTNVVSGELSITIGSEYD